ncbi:MAG TPA: hypothetical protein VHE34_09245 [Puia sp.]|uniref:hypothetical protein n=1 Tax=Puia sp. TaxID=2045100 RepID=UPI002C2DD540|nr:hypothetical protein [Puia sp.]HVU95398.1 hypothetical protein [Puia sp.]
MGGSRRQLFVEIARKDGDNVTDPAGDYRSAWIDEPAEGTVIATLHIQQNGTVYTFVWRDGATTLFTGAGMRLGPDRLVVTYWGGAATQFRLPG